MVDNNTQQQTITMHELVRNAFHDQEFTRFLKEKNVYPLAKKNYHATNPSYHKQTISSGEFFKYFLTNRRYLVRLFPWLQQKDNIPWATLHDQWVQHCRKQNSIFTL